MVTTWIARQRQTHLVSLSRPDKMPSERAEGPWMTFRTIVGSLALALLAVTPARAGDCDLKLVTSVDMLPLQGRMEVPVSVNGIPKLLLLDTGGATSQLSPNTVQDLKLAYHETHLRIYNASGY